MGLTDLPQRKPHLDRSKYNFAVNDRVSTNFIGYAVIAVTFMCVKRIFYPSFYRSLESTLNIPATILTFYFLIAILIVYSFYKRRWPGIIAISSMVLSGALLSFFTADMANEINGRKDFSVGQKNTCQIFKEESLHESYLVKDRIFMLNCTPTFDHYLTVDADCFPESKVGTKLTLNIHEGYFQDPWYECPLH